MRIRAELTLDGETRKPHLVGGPSELDEHVAHKLAAYLLFWKDDPVLDANSRHPALAGYDFFPDLVAFDDAGGIKLWVECGTTTLHKLTKVTRRAPRARIVVMKETEREAERLRKDLLAQFDRPERVEILAWPGSSYKDWVALTGEKVEGFGEADGRSLNAVVNETPVLVEFKPF